MPSSEVSNGIHVENGAHATPPTNGPASPVLSNGVDDFPYLSTEPSPNQSWQITLKDKVIAITGANRGIGLGIAQVCLENSALKVYSLDLMEPGDDFVILSKKHPNLKYVQTDVTDEASIEAALDKIVEAEGRFDGMVANAGMTKHQSALNFSREEVLKLFNLNVFGAFSCAQIAARKFIKLGIKGSIVFTASMTSYRPNRAAPSAPYGGTKGAVRNMTHTLGKPIYCTIPEKFATITNNFDQQWSGLSTGLE
jgi:NADP-dependent 3-hydroxy acid dehydrogenase YdfG